MLGGMIKRNNPCRAAERPRAKIGMRRPVPRSTCFIMYDEHNLSALKGARRRNRPWLRIALLSLDWTWETSAPTSSSWIRRAEPIEETRIPTTEPAFRPKFASLPPCRVAMEAGTHSRWASRLLEQLGHEVLVANPRRLRLIYENSRKADEADAEHLARLARLDPQLLSPIRHRGPEAQAHLTVIRSRDSLVRARTLLINHVRGSVKGTGARLRACSADSFHHRVAPAIPTELAPALLPVLETIASLTAQIHAYNRQIEQLCQEHYPETQGLRAVGGMGPITSLAYVLTLDDPDRFRKSREVAPSLGLVPKR